MTGSTMLADLPGGHANNHGEDDYEVLRDIVHDLAPEYNSDSDVESEMDEDPYLYQDVRDFQQRRKQGQRNGNGYENRNGNGNGYESDEDDYYPRRKKTLFEKYGTRENIILGSILIALALIFFKDRILIYLASQTNEGLALKLLVGVVIYLLATR